MNRWASDRMQKLWFQAALQALLLSLTKPWLWACSTKEQHPDLLRPLKLLISNTSALVAHLLCCLKPPFPKRRNRQMMKSPNIITPFPRFPSHIMVSSINMHSGLIFDHPRSKLSVCDQTVCDIFAHCALFMPSPVHSFIERFSLNSTQKTAHPIEAFSKASMISVLLLVCLISCSCWSSSSFIASVPASHALLTSKLASNGVVKSKKLLPFVMLKWISVVPAGNGIQFRSA